MHAFKRIIFEALVLAVVAVGVGFGANALRGKGMVKPTLNYFEKGGLVGKAAAPNGAKARTKTDDSQPIKKLEHPYQELTFDEVVDIFNDPTVDTGHYLFVDARKDEEFQAGHIPGAIQCNHYRLEEYIYPLIDRADGAEKIVVYCGGGNCEDSIFVCKDLTDFDIPFEAIYLYSGGWKEWSQKGMPSEKGAATR